MSFSRVTKDLGAARNPLEILPQYSRLQVFRKMCPVAPKIIDKYMTAHEASKPKQWQWTRDRECAPYWFFLTIRIYIYAVNATLRTRKSELKMFWNDLTFVKKFKDMSDKTKLSSKYHMWSKRFTTMVCDIDVWKPLSDVWTSGSTLPEVLAADEKNKKHRCRRSPWCPW